MNNNEHHVPDSQPIDLDEYAALHRELEELKVQTGEKKEGRISRMISGFFQRKDARQKVLVSKKAHLLLAIFLGWAGAHRFQTRRWVLGILYLATCWSGFSVAMTIVDILEIIPMKPDENGNILI